MWLMAAMSLVWAHWALGLFIPLFLAIWLRTHTGRSLFQRGTLEYDQGQWHYCADLLPRRLSLRQAWPAGAFMTLRFDDLSAVNERRLFQITIWKAGLTPGSWQRLCLLVGQDLQFSDTRGAV